MKKILVTGIVIISTSFSSTAQCNCIGGILDGSAANSGLEIFFCYLFGGVSDCLTLPVELTSFEGNYLEEVNELKWTTASEINNDYFSLERSEDGIEFAEIAVIDGSGNSTIQIDYEYKDASFRESNINYYRLKQVDFDGVYEYHDIIAIKNTYVKPKLIGVFNLLGQPVGTSYKGIVVDVYSDGEKVKRLQ